MKLKTEIFIAKVVTAAIVILTLLMATRAHAGEIADLFKRYNKKLSEQQALQFEAIVEEAGKHFGISPSLIAAIIVVESSARPNAISKGGDYGLMQVRWKVHNKDYPQLKSHKDLLEPRNNIFIGTEIYARYYAKKKSTALALKRYSGGSRKTARKVLNVLRELNFKEANYD